MADLSRRLTKLLGDDSHPVILFSLTLLANLCLQENLGSKVSFTAYPMIFTDDRFCYFDFYLFKC